jgi:hypothetical protein
MGKMRKTTNIFVEEPERKKPPGWYMWEDSIRS